MENQYKTFRRLSKMAKFELECRCVQINGRYVKAYKVPGTSEHGQMAMFNHLWETLRGREIQDVYRYFRNGGAK